MWAFFRGWRRKAGVVALVMACVSAIAWHRSYYREDDFRIRITDRNVVSLQHSENCLLAMRMWTGSEKNAAPINFFIDQDKRLQWDSSPRESELDLPDLDHRWNLGRFALGRGSDPVFADVGKVGTAYIRIPYWTIASILVFASAYLILWKPRGRKTSAPPENLNLISN